MLRCSVKEKEREAICDPPGVRGAGRGKVSCECISYLRRSSCSSGGLHYRRGNVGAGYLNAAM